MDPAYSVIVFTSASGAGYGLLIWLALARLSGAWEIAPVTALASCLVGLALVTTGLLSSTLHLGRPERSWRAVSQWRSSWLSREGVAALLTYPPALVFTVGWLYDIVPEALMDGAAAATLTLSVITVICTGMIYASLRTIPRWSNGWVVPVYLALSLASGSLLFALAVSVSGSAGRRTLGLVLAVLLIAWMIKVAYWRHIDAQRPASDSGTATGLGHLGAVRQLESPHTSENYLLREMGYVVARKHASRLRHMALMLGLMIPGVLILLGMQTGGGPLTMVLTAALASGLGGIVVERWLFFAEARHVVTLYYCSD